MIFDDIAVTSEIKRSTTRGAAGKRPRRSTRFSRISARDGSVRLGCTGRGNRRDPQCAGLVEGRHSERHPAQVA